MPRDVVEGLGRVDNVGVGLSLTVNATSDTFLCRCRGNVG